MFHHVPSCSIMFHPVISSSCGHCGHCGHCGIIWDSCGRAVGIQGTYLDQFQSPNGNNDAFGAIGGEIPASASRYSGQGMAGDGRGATWSEGRWKQKNHEQNMNFEQDTSGQTSKWCCSSFFQFNKVGFWGEIEATRINKQQFATSDDLISPWSAGASPGPRRQDSWTRGKSMSSWSVRNVCCPHFCRVILVWLKWTKRAAAMTDSYDSYDMRMVCQTYPSIFLPEVCGSCPHLICKWVKTEHPKMRNIYSRYF